MRASAANASPARSRKRARQRLAAKLVVLGVVGLLCLAMLELLVRVFMPYYNPRNQLFLYPNEEGVVLGQPNTTVRQGTPKGDFDTTVAINRHGFRDVKDYTQASPDDVSVMGDSFSFGAGVEAEERYSNQLEQQLGVRVYNLSTPAEDLRGYGRALGFLERHDWSMHHVILGVCMENDLWDYASITNTHVVYRQQMVQSVKHKAAVWIKTHSALWTCASHALQRHDALRRFFEWIGVARSVDELTHKNVSTPQVLTSSRDQLLRFTTNYHTLLLIIPSRANWYGDNQAVERETHAGFVELLRQSGMDLVDMKPIFEQSGAPLDYYYRNDPHWNPRGHAAAARALHQHMLQADDWAFARP